ncbi:MAG: hypothetical protein AAFP19_04235 [Bacteroidota bacterium]
MLAARALFYALVVSLLIALVSGLLISLAYLQRLQQTDQFEQERLYRNVKSAMAIAQAGLLPSPRQSLDLFGDGGDTVHWARFDWGVYSIAYAEAVRWTPLGRDTLQQVACLGARSSPLMQSALYLSDQNAPLAVAGNTQIKGKALLPRAGVRRGYIGGVGYLGSQLVYGDQEKSTSALPPINSQKADQILPLFSQPGNTPYLPLLNRSFADSAAIIQTDAIYLTGIAYRGHIMVIASDSIVVAADATLEDVMLLAPKIIFEPGFEGQLQAFASKAMEVGEGCRFEFPSVLGLLKSEKVNDRPFLNIAPDCQLNGLVWVYQKYYTKYPVRLSIGERSRIEGQVFADGLVEHKGVIHGNLTCKSFSLKTSSSVYHNHLFNAVIDRNQLSKHYLSPLLAKEVRQSGVAKWIK